MKKLITRVIVFLLVAIPAYITLILFWGLVSPANDEENLFYKIGGKGHMFSRMQEVKYTHEVDVVFAGSSLAARGFDNRIFAKHGIRSFNLGSGGQTPLQTKWLLEKYLVQLNPKLVILEANPYILSKDGTEPSLDLISNHDFEWSMFEMAFQINNIKVYNTLIYAWWRKVLGLNKNFVEEKIKGEDTYVNGGFIEKKISYFKLADAEKDKHFSLIPIDYQRKTFMETVAYIKSKNIKLLLIEPPLTHAILKNYTDEYGTEQFLKSAGEYYNFTQFVNLNDTVHFFDSRHLNQLGVEKFNEKLIEFLLTKNKLNK